MEVAYLLGAFDLLGVDQLDVIEQAREHCDRLVVGVLTDEDVFASSGLRPVVPLHERVSLVKHVRGVAAVVVHGSNQAAELPVDTSFALAGEVDDNDLAGFVLLRTRCPTQSTVLSRLRRQHAGEAVA